MDSKLLNMSQKELKELKAKVTFLLENKPVEVGIKQEGYVQLFLDVLDTSLQRRLLKKVPPLVVLRASTKYRSILSKLYKAVSCLNDWSESALNRRLNRPEKLTMYSLASELTCDYLNRIGVPINLKTIINCYERFPSLIQSAFPGYIESGLLHIILNSKEQDIDKDMLK